jgi:hypothetical protein
MSISLIDAGASIDTVSASIHHFRQGTEGTHPMWRQVTVAAAGIVIGLASAGAAISQLGAGGGVRIGPWQSPIDAGGPGRGGYLRAAAALKATLALSRQEAIYFRATTDSQGNPLRGTCTYSVHGSTLPARWWSITVYGDDGYLIANPENSFAYASVNVSPAADSGFQMRVGPAGAPLARQDGWLDTAGRSRISLLARLYQPSQAAAVAPALIDMPRIDWQGCP